MTGDWIDISQPLHNGIAEWPGDTPFSYEVAFKKADTGSVNIGKLTTSTHIGTHIDAPFHFADDGEKVHELPIDTYIGRARVIDLSEAASIGRQELEAVDFGSAERILLKTGGRKDLTVFPELFTYLRADIAPLLQERGVRLIGIESPSVDPEQSKTLDAHHALYAHQIMILENIVLDDVVPGDYELIALPLPLHGADGSPVRAVIRAIKEVD
ncbi:arylformamidase [Sporosarcina pasteurii]|uniref:Kynurenine formamidase n=1 Tax=Sporosarcina pasteurii TaxID=1474 RepID=A0A380CKT3_SPOPA|nr:arylformamidase [Sporosarcina pasteurii]MDS9471927.1 arylformamidase [Sporosarcina pasteurii]QBQ06659.1 arylformamidase [Sporosarcina pasteurii]SUJ21936.1 Kynurenine formamidase [Sporosarcina pasteurii]